MKYGIAYHREQNAPLILVQSFRRGTVPIALVGLIDGVGRREQGERLMRLPENLHWRQKRWNPETFFEAGILAMREWTNRLTAEKATFALLFAVEDRVFLCQNTGNCFLVQRRMGTASVTTLPGQLAGQMELGACLLFAQQGIPDGVRERIGGALLLSGQETESKLRRRLAEIFSDGGGGFLFVLRGERNER